MTSTGTREWAGPSRHYRPCSNPADPTARHWGPDGAAGALAWLECADGERCVLLARRSPHVQQGGTWAFPGGAIDAGESPLQGALRELTEEVAADLRPVRLTGVLEARCPHGCGWTYTSFAVQVEALDGDVMDAGIAPGHSAWETTDVAWFPLAAVDSLELHPGFAVSWPALRKMIENAQVSES